MTKYLMVISFLIFLVCAVSDLAGQPYAWQNYTNKNEITSLGNYAGYIWATSTGGVARIELATDAVKTYINSDGLGSVSASFSTFAGNGTAYFGSVEGYLTTLDIAADNLSTLRLLRRDGQALKLLAADTSDGILWIATEIGVVKFDRFRHGGEVKETYRTLGQLPTETTALNLLTFAGKLYVATARGLAIAEQDNLFLLDPNEWSSIAGNTGGLNADSVLALEVFGGRVFAGTDAGLFRLEGDSTFTEIDRLSGWRVLDMALGDEELYLVADSGFLYGLFMIDSWFDVAFVDTLPAGANCLAISPQPIVGTETDGIFIYEYENNSYQPVDLPGPASNDLVGGGITSTGTIYTVSRFASYSTFKDGVWEKTTFTPNTKLSALVDREDNLWIGTHGRGVYYFDLEGEQTRFHSRNSDLTGNNDNPETTYVVVNSIYQDHRGNLWFSSFRGFPLRPLVMFNPTDSVWTHFDGDDGVISDLSQCVAAGDGFAALGYQDHGIAFLDYGAEPVNHADDLLEYYGTNRLLPSNNVTALTVDRDNVLWVGTNLGLASFDDDIRFFTPVALPDEVSGDVRALTTDSRNNLWVGTTDGLAFISFGQTKKLAFTTTDSFLLNDDIRALFFDEMSGRLLIFTAGGLSILDYNLGGTLAKPIVYAYPNPFIITAGGEQVLDFTISQRAEVRIYNIAGELVRLITRTDFNQGWDGANDDGRPVASGVYIYELVADDQSRFTGKIFLLRR
ncbi:MAG: T9SS type A sorting domain-containing protein [candidate division Zixibacteria bacterium]|nr:T9SS type A sorting domain-containing protein [candidate division Zixibacteria bacterium]